MNNPINLAIELKNELMKESIFKQYFELKEKFENDPNLKLKRKEIALLKKSGNIQEYEKKKKEYFAHPLVNNFYILQENIKEELAIIKDILSE